MYQWGPEYMLKDLHFFIQMKNNKEFEYQSII